MDDRAKRILSHYLEPVPTPHGVASREIVRRAIDFDDPPRIPFSFVHPLRSDFFEVTVADMFLGGRDQSPSAGRGAVYHDPWGVGWRVTGRGWDHAVDHPLSDLNRLDRYQPPDVIASERFSRLKPWVKRAREAGKYVVGFDPILMFERMRALVGFEELMVAPYTQPGGLERLVDLLAGMTVSAIERWAELGGVDGFMTWEDWGLQTRLQMKPETFRRFYKPRYERIIRAAHLNGMHYIWHNCGQILDMIPDMIDMGVDVLQLDQPRLMGHKTLAGGFGGRICFWNTVDIQWSADPRVTDAELRAEVEEMVRVYGRFNGGFMARHYPQPGDIGLSRERCRTIASAFLEFGGGGLDWEGLWSPSDPKKHC